MRKGLALFLALVVSAGLLTGCGSATTANDESDSFTIVSMMTSETLDPTVDINSIDKPAGHAIYDTLVAFGPDAEIVPMLAESWTESDNGLDVTFKLREDVKFHDGSQFTADDVVYTFDTMIQSASNYRVANNLKSCVKDDDYTVTFTKATPYAKIYNVLAEYVYVVCKAAREKDPAGFAENPVGTGPYMYLSTGADDSVTLQAFDAYYGQKAAFQNAIIKPPMDAATAVIALETGEIDLTMWLPATQASIVGSNDELTLVTDKESWSMYSLLLMGDTLKDNDLRKAIFHGINRENAIKLGNGGNGEPATNLFANRLMDEYCDIVEIEGYNSALAEECLAKSAYKGEELLLSFYGGQTIVESVQADLKKIGINVRLEQLDYNSFEEKVSNGAADMAFCEFGNDVRALEDFMTNFSVNDSMYGSHMESNDEFEQLLTDMSTELDKEARYDMVKRAQEIMYDMANVVPLFSATFNYAYGPSISYDYPSSASTYVFYPGLVTKP